MQDRYEGRATDRSRLSEQRPVTTEAERRLQAVYARFSPDVELHQREKVRKQADQDYGDFFLPLQQEVQELTRDENDENELSESVMMMNYRTNESTRTNLKGALNPLRPDKTITEEALLKLVAGNELSIAQLNRRISSRSLGRTLIDRVATALVNEFSPSPIPTEKRKRSQQEKVSSPDDLAPQAAFTPEERLTFTTAIKTFFAREPELLTQMFDFFGQTMTATPTVETFIPADILEKLILGLEEKELVIEPLERGAALKNRLKWIFVSWAEQPKSYGEPTQKAFRSMAAKLKRLGSLETLTQRAQSSSVDVQPIIEAKRMSQNPRLTTPETAELESIEKFTKAKKILADISAETHTYLEELHREVTDPALDNARVIQEVVSITLEMEALSSELSALGSQELDQVGQQATPTWWMRGGGRQIVASQLHFLTNPDLSLKRLHDVVTAQLSDLSKPIADFGTSLSKMKADWQTPNSEITHELPNFARALQEKIPVLEALSQRLPLLAEQLTQEQQEYERTVRELTQQVMNEARKSGQRFSEASVMQAVRSQLNLEKQKNNSSLSGLTHPDRLAYDGDGEQLSDGEERPNNNSHTLTSRRPNS